MTINIISQFFNPSTSLNKSHTHLHYTNYKCANMRYGLIKLNALVIQSSVFDCLQGSLIGISQNNGLQVVKK